MVFKLSFPKILLSFIASLITLLYIVNVISGVTGFETVVVTPVLINDCRSGIGCMSHREFSIWANGMHFTFVSMSFLIVCISYTISSKVIFVEKRGSKKNG